jgi:hypothetical protein
LNKALFSALAGLFVTSCGLMPSSKPDSAAPVLESFDETREAVLVFGLVDAKARVQLEAGDVIDSRYRAEWSNIYPLFYGAADRGFVLVKVPADRPIAITSISTENRWKQFWAGGPFRTCKGQTVVVFQVPKGKVFYYSDFDFLPNAGGLRINATNNLAGARRYVDSKFPKLSGRLESASFGSLIRADDCQKIERMPRREAAAR